MKIVPLKKSFEYKTTTFTPHVSVSSENTFRGKWDVVWNRLLFNLLRPTQQLLMTCYSKFWHSLQKSIYDMPRQKVMFICPCYHRKFRIWLSFI